MKKYYYVYAYDHDDSDYHEPTQYSTQFDWGVTEFRELKDEKDIQDFGMHVHRLATNRYFKALISWQEINK